MTQGFFQFNSSIINEISDFVISSFDLLYLSGPKGSSKSETIENTLQRFSTDNLIFQHFCFQNTTIDDFLLNFYDALRNFSLAQKISLKKFTSDNFKEKVSHYFKTINSNCIIAVENFEKIDQNIEIIDFLAHLASYSNVKIIIISRNSEKNLFRFKKIKMKTLEIKQITKEEFKSKLSILSEPLEERVKEAFYQITQGLELYLKMSLKYTKTAGVSIADLIGEFERKSESSKTNFEEFLISKFISITPSIYKDFFKTLCSFSHPVSIELLENYSLGKSHNIEYLTNNFLINKFKDEIYVKDYFKQYIVNKFSIQEKIIYFKKLVDIYENELTKSPKDRLIRLSRESMRKEIEFFNSKIPQINSANAQKNLPYLGVGSIWDEKAHQKAKLKEKMDKIKERKNFLTQEERGLLIAKRLENTNQKSLIDENKRKNREFIIKLINSSRDFTKEYRYNDAISELNRASSVDVDEEFKIEILTLIAKNYEFLNDYQKAQEFLNIALEIAIEKRDSRKCEIEYSLALINKNLYKIDIAKAQFKQIASNELNIQNYRAKAYIELGEIEEASSNLENAIKYYENAVSLSLGKNKELVCKSYYKLAVLYDENQDNENAIKYYQKNYTTSSEKKENKYYSNSLTNLALIYIEMSKFKEASDFLKLALHFDSEYNDLENMYFSQKELAKLYSKTDEISAIGYYKQALDSAKKLNDKFKEALVHFEAGEFYYDKLEDKKALTSFLNAKEVLKNTNNSENISRINSRIKDIKIRLDEITFNLIMEKYDNK